MNLRHAAALALVGWYLMVPPPALLNEAIRGSEAHLSLWERRREFYASALDCEHALKKLQAETQRQKERDLQGAAEMDANLDQHAINTYKSVGFAKCVSTDDPRLKRN